MNNNASDIIYNIFNDAFTGKTWSRESFDQMLKGCNYIYDECSAILYNAAADEVEILNIAVVKKHQNRGVASKLLTKFLKDIAQNHSKVFLEVAVNNKSAIALYKKFDFEIVGKRKNYYKDETGKPSVDALIMRKNI